MHMTHSERAHPDLILPDYWLSQPSYSLTEEERRACDALLSAALAQGAEQPLAYTLPIPKWRFLCYLAETHQLALHGSANAEITRFEPRQPQDLSEFGAQNAVYAASDGIWPMYFAIVNRAKSPSVINACVTIEDENGMVSHPYYFFSISRQAVDRQPYHAGVVYLLPRESFVSQPPQQLGLLRIHVAQLASATPVVPLAKLAVAPEDFPFLAQMRTHDDARLAEYGEAMARGLPWPDAV
jgi:hypothetical protein